MGHHWVTSLDKERVGVEGAFGEKWAKFGQCFDGHRGQVHFSNLAPVKRWASVHWE